MPRKSEQVPCTIQRTIAHRISQYINATLQAERANYENLIKSLEDNAARVTDNMAEP
ncbi:MAG: hypothetical protein ACLTDF_05400 [Coprococcus sp.]